MKQTEHYGLSQWELTDRIQMEDFNADNAKLDTALAGKIGKAVVVWDCPRGSHFGGGYTLNVFKMDKFEYTAISVEFTPSDIDPSKTLEVKLANNKKKFTFPLQNFIMVFFPHHSPASRFRCLLLCDNPQYIVEDGTYEELVGIHLDTIPPFSVPDADLRYLGWS